MISETAFAKINLALHVRRRRGDGYHELETLFAFVDAGDRLTARAAERDAFTVSGEFAPQLADPFGNIIAKALAKLPRPNGLAGGLAIDLEKCLPVAAGLGGGSADAGAVFRIVEALHGLPEDWRKRAESLGADVPACVESRMCLGHGTGTELSSVDNDLEGTPVLLVNPRVPLATGPVFAGWGGADGGALPQGPASRIAAEGRNDLEAPAILLCPVVADVLAALRGTDAFLSRMSGSGATCFALFRSHDVMNKASESLKNAHPEWWQMQGSLRA